MLVLAVRRGTVIRAAGIWAAAFLGGLAELTAAPADRSLCVCLCMGAVMGLSASLAGSGLWKRREFSLRATGVTGPLLAEGGE